MKVLLDGHWYLFIHDTLKLTASNKLHIKIFLHSETILQSCTKVKGRERERERERERHMFITTAAAVAANSC